MTTVTDRHQGDRAKIPVSILHRMTLILETFEHRAQALGLEEIVGRTGLPRSTAHRILESLVRMDWLEHRSIGYLLGSRSQQFNDSGISHEGLRSVVAPHLHELRMRSGMIVVFSVLEGDQEVVLDRVGGPFAMPESSSVGYRGPAWCSVSGRAMIAMLPAAQRAEALLGIDEEPDSVRAVVAAELDRIREADGLSGRGTQLALSVNGVDGQAAAIRLEPDRPTAGDGARRPGVRREADSAEKLWGPVVSTRAAAAGLLRAVRQAVTGDLGAASAS